MSSIDTVDNVHCANLHLVDSMVPVYWVLQETEHDRTGCVVTIHDLMIGGGSGEHPALHIRNADLLPLWLVADTDSAELELEFIGQSVEDFYMKKLFSRASSEHELKIFESYPNINDNFMCIADWPLSTLYEVEKSYRKAKKENKNLKNSDNMANSSESSLLRDIALFVFYQMPEQFFEKDVWLAIKQLRGAYLQEVYDLVRVNHFSHPLLNSSSGKIIRDGKACWGYSLHDYIQDQKELKSV
jgi:hypothetical protein